MTHLVICSDDGVLRADSRRLAERLGVTNKAFIALLRKHLHHIESAFGRVLFEKAPSQTAGGMQNLTVAFLTEAQAELALSFSKNTDKAVELKIALIKAFQKAKALLQNEKSLGNLEMQAHVRVEIQKAMSKVANGVNYRQGGVTQIIDYNRHNCKFHTGYFPHELKAFCKSRGYKNITSGKDAARKTMPAAACCMSLTDQLLRMGYPYEIAAVIARKFQPGFQAMLEVGHRPAEFYE